jgi:2-oxoacid:acceptor oxidoreductase gamma subunit (pyruvate/2-ketoisovalerate family)
MTEIRFHGRGGQGVVVASEILASAFFREGKHVQAFPTFGVERRGAPVAAFLRVSSRPIRLRCQIQRPDHVIILDPTLIPAVDVIAGLNPAGWILINSENPPRRFARLAQGGRQIATVDASAIAVAQGLGNRTNPIVNTAILGAFAAATHLVDLASVLHALREWLPGRTEENIQAAREAARRVRTLLLEGVGL